MKVMILAFLCLTVTLIIAGCAGAADEVLSASTLTSTSAPTSSPSAAPLISTATPSASLTPTLAPTDTPTAEPTATPTPQIGDARTINEDLQVFVGQDWVNLPEEAIDNEYVFRLVDDGMFLVDNEDYPKYTLRTDQENGGLTWEEVLQFVHGYAVKDGEAYQEVNGELQKVTFSPEIQEALRSGEIEISGMVEVQQEKINNEGVVEKVNAIAFTDDEGHKTITLDAQNGEFVQTTTREYMDNGIKRPFEATIEKTINTEVQNLTPSADQINALPSAGVSFLNFPYPDRGYTSGSAVLTNVLPIKVTKETWKIEVGDETRMLYPQIVKVVYTQGGEIYNGAMVMRGRINLQGYYEDKVSNSSLLEFRTGEAFSVAFSFVYKEGAENKITYLEGIEEKSELVESYYKGYGGDESDFRDMVSSGNYMMGGLDSEYVPGILYADYPMDVSE